MTASRFAHHLRLAVALSAMALVASCSGSSSHGKAPRVDAVPAQQTDGGVPFSLDLSPWLISSGSGPVTLQVLSGGGSIAGATYTNTFDTVGRKSVLIRAANPVKSTDFGFEVAVQTAELAVVQAGTGLVVLDRGTTGGFTALEPNALYGPQVLTVSADQGFTDTFQAALARGALIFERAKGGQSDLFVFDPNDRSRLRLGDDPQNTTDERFQASTTDGRIVFTSGMPSDPDLFIHNTITGLTREISAVEDVAEGNAVADANNIVYFEVGPSAQRDIYLYDPSTDDLDPISNDAANEVIRGVVTGGGVVFSRDNGAGDIDLWFYRTGVGLAQIGADVATAGFQDLALTYNGSTPNGMVVFTASVTPTNTDLYYWDPTTQVTTAVATNALHDTFHAVTSHNKIIYSHEVSGADVDVHSRLVGGADTDLSATADLDLFQAVTSLNDVVFLRAGNALQIWDDSAGSLVTADSGAPITFDAALSSGNVVYTKSGTGLRRWLSAGGVATVSATGAYAGPMAAGTDFAVKVTVSLQDDLWLWNEGTTTLELMVDDAADERYVTSGSGTTNVLVFTRETPATNHELWVWDATNGARQLSQAGLDHTLAGTYLLDNR